MSRWFSAVRWCGALAAAAMIAPVAPAAAAPVDRTAGFYCYWPSARGGLVTFTATAPYGFAEQRGTAPVKITARDDYSRLQELGIGSVDGFATLALRINDGDTALRFNVEVPLPETKAQAGVPTVLDFSKSIPQLEDAEGPVAIWLESATLHLNAYDADGFPTPVPDRATTGPGGIPVTQPDDPTAFRVPCGDVDSPRGIPIATFLAGSDTLVPLGPPAAISDELGSTTLALDWSRPRGTFQIRGYSIEVTRGDGVFAGESWYESASDTATGKIITRLGAGRRYAVTVTAVDVNGASVVIYRNNTLSTLSAAPAPITRSLAATATVNLPSIAKKPFLLTGTANLTATGIGHAVTGTFDFQPVLTRLTVRPNGLPISSKIALVRSGPASGTFTNSLLNVSQSVRLKVLDARAFGAIPIELGNECQTKELSKLALSSGVLTPAGWPISFATFNNGKVTSRFPVSDLNGCAAIAAGFNPQAAGTGDISVSLAPPPATSAGSSAG